MPKVALGKLAIPRSSPVLPRVHLGAEGGTRQIGLPSVSQQPLSIFCRRPFSPSVTLGVYCLPSARYTPSLCRVDAECRFAECFVAFAECPWHSASHLCPVVYGLEP